MMQLKDIAIFLMLNVFYNSPIIPYEKFIYAHKKLLPYLYMIHFYLRFIIMFLYDMTEETLNINDIENKVI